jgi:adenylylsulfate kinase
MQDARHGTVWWITGMSAAGKSTVAHLVHQRLWQRGRPALMLDGDVLRAVLGQTHGHGPEERQRLACTYGRLGLEIARQGIDAVCATISMFHSVRAWNRQNIPHYREIYLRVPLAELERRDPRGLYGRYRAGQASSVVGLDVPLEEPTNPDLVIDNWGGMTAEEAARRILELEFAP